MSSDGRGDLSWGYTCPGTRRAFQQRWETLNVRLPRTAEQVTEAER